MNKVLKNILWGLIVFAILIIIWAICFFSVKNEQLIPSISKTFQEMFNYLGSEEFYKSFGATMLRVLIGFLVSVLFALVCGFLSIRFQYFKKILSPLISIVRAIPTMAITLLLLIYFSPKTTPVVITFMVLFPMLYTLILSSYNNINPNYFTLARVYKVSNKDKYLKIILPNMFPIVLDNLGSNLSFAIKLTISAELVAKTYVSIGNMLNDAKMYFETAANLFALTFITIIVALLVEFILNIISMNAFKKWRVRNDQD